MLALVWLIPVFPLAGFLCLVLLGRRLPAGVVAVLGPGPVGLSMVVSLLVTTTFLHAPPPGLSYSLALWTWFDAGGLAPGLGFYLDGLSCLMVAVVTVVAFLIHLYSTRFMAGDPGYARFFAYMNLFVGSMLILVLADNLLFLYLGWEGVGLCSYLLIGFWYREPKNAHAAIKAFVVTRLGDTSLALALFLLALSLGTLQIQELTRKAAEVWVPGSLAATTAAALLLGGALGKSAQLPLQTWLPDAMAGPTPVSALIHAATMVTAGVYLIARMHGLFLLAPDVQLAIALIGAMTLLIAGASALTQRDMKRVLAYSTMSQVGYMFLALGVGAWWAAIFHLVTHAFFKALLFLSAGVVIQALDEEHDIFKMGGLRRSLPVAFWTFLIGAASLSALPFVTAGFYSKDLILSLVWSSAKGGVWLWMAGVLGALLTALYAFRVVFVVFFGTQTRTVEERSTKAVKIPLIILALFAVAAGVLAAPQTPGGAVSLAALTQAALPVIPPGPGAGPGAFAARIVTSLVPLLGIFLAALFYLVRPSFAAAILRHRPFSALHGFWFSGWGFDGAYRTLFVDPFVRLARLNGADGIDFFYRALGRAAELGHRALVPTQSGNVRWYVMGIALGGAILIAVVLFL